MRKTNKILILAFALMGLSVNVANAQSGACGAKLNWSFSYSTGELTITGSGAMANYDNGIAVPWFSYRNYITSVSLPAGITSIGDYAFSFCSNLTSITIPELVTSIGERAFSYCSGLKSISFPNSLTSISAYAFIFCSDLTSITIPNLVTWIGFHAFESCNLTSITIGNSVKTIDSGAFSHNNNLTSITIPKSVTLINDNTFDVCSSLTAITVAEDNNNYCSIDGILYNKQKTTLIRCPEGKIGTVTIPHSVTSIAGGAFYRCSGLTSITIPELVTTIGTAAFAFCSNLTSITIPELVNSLGNSAFSDCNGLTSIISHAINAPQIGSYAFNNVPSDIPVYVPCGSVDNYQTAWGSIFSNIQEALTCTDITDIEVDEETGITIAPSDTTARVAWFANPDATGYTLVIYEDDNRTKIVCSLEFDAEGRLKGISFPQAAKQKMQNAATEDILGIKINNLSPKTTYFYTMQVLGEDNIVLDTKKGSFVTTGDIPTAVVGAGFAPVSKVVGYYNTFGQKLPQEPENGIYIMLYDNGKAEKVLK